jgi:ATP sulfurylase
MVQKELEDSKMLQEKAMFKEVIRAKEGELYSTVKIEEVYKRFDEKPKQNDKKINSDKRHPNLPKYLINGDSVC